MIIYTIAGNKQVDLFLRSNGDLLVTAHRGKLTESDFDTTNTGIFAGWKLIKLTDCGKRAILEVVP